LLPLGTTINRVPLKNYFSKVVIKTRIVPAIWMYHIKIMITY
jgi:hypothetical protein